MTIRFLFLATALLAAQPPTPPGPAGPPATAAPKPRPRPSAFPERPPADPAVIARGKAVYGVHCTFCHGADARGGSGGPNLIRNEVVLNDQNGELLGKVLREGREGMPKFDLPGTQVSDIAAFIHSFKVGGYDVSRNTPETIVTGDAKAGAAYFAKTCAGCHSVMGDLKGLASRFRDPKQLQQWWLMPGGGGGRGGFGMPAPAGRVSPPTVTVTLADGKTHQGTLTRIDDFLVTLTEASGQRRTFTRNGDLPKVEIKDPLKPHKDLLPKYEDKNIHDVTAYLVSIP
jgi:cytochrome c oxidase cbb3-type subunit III